MKQIFKDVVVRRGKGDVNQEHVFNGATSTRDVSCQFQNDISVPSCESSLYVEETVIRPAIEEYKSVCDKEDVYSTLSCNSTLSSGSNEADVHTSEEDTNVYQHVPEFVKSVTTKASVVPSEPDSLHTTLDVSRTNSLSFGDDQFRSSYPSDGMAKVEKSDEYEKRVQVTDFDRFINFLLQMRSDLDHVIQNRKDIYAGERFGKCLIFCESRPSYTRCDPLGYFERVDIKDIGGHTFKKVKYVYLIILLVCIMLKS